MNSQKVRKGQTLIFEQVMLFSVSVAIFVICFSVFSVYENYFVSVTSNNQLDEVKEWVSASILKVAEKDSATSILTLNVPRKVGDAVYELSLSEDGLVAKNLLTNTERSSSLYDLGKEFSFSGETTSINGKVTIKKEDKQIIIV